jgi:hypothetical protein
VLRAVLVLVVGALLGGSTAHAAMPSIYVGYDGDNCTFQLTNDAGAVVTTLAPGTYQVVIITHDPYGLTGSCNGFVQFRLTGPGVALFTTLDYGDQTYEVDNETFQAGATYAMQDDGNAAASHLTFTVATSGSPVTVQTTTTTTKTTTKPAPAPTVKTTTGALEGLVSKAGAVSITTRTGKPVTSLKSGRYTFSVHDLSAVRGFSLQLLSGSAQVLTSPRYVGWRDVTVRLAPGRWTVSAGTRKKTFFVTS